MIYQNGMLALAWAPSNPILSFHTECFITIQKLKNSSKLGNTVAMQLDQNVSKS